MNQSNGQGKHMSIKISEMEGATLDGWVAKAEKLDVRFSTTERYWRIAGNAEDLHWAPHKDWAQAGPIIEREAITLIAPKIGHLWEANCGDTVETQIACNGRTPLEAAMRVFAISRFGKEVES